MQAFLWRPRRLRTGLLGISSAAAKLLVCPPYARRTPLRTADKSAIQDHEERIPRILLRVSLAFEYNEVSVQQALID